MMNLAARNIGQRLSAGMRKSTELLQFWIDNEDHDDHGDDDDDGDADDDDDIDAILDFGWFSTPLS